MHELRLPCPVDPLESQVIKQLIGSQKQVESKAGLMHEQNMNIKLKKAGVWN